MQKRHLFSAVVGSCALASMALPASAAILTGSLFTNATFETGTGTTATGWTQGSGVTRDAAAANTGSYGMQVVIGQAQEQRLQQNIAASTGDTDYDWSIDLKRVTDIVGADVQVWVQWHGGGQEIIPIAGNNPATTYTTYGGTVHSPLTATTGADIFLRLATGAVDGAGGTVYADNFDFAPAAPTPEPASLSLLALGGLTLIRRRRA